MLGVLQDILCMVAAVGAFVLWSLMSAVNLLIAGLGAAAQGFIDLLPDLPAAPSPPGGKVLAYVNYFYPVGAVMGVFAVILSLWLVLLGLSVALRWAKVF